MRPSIVVIDDEPQIHELFRDLLEPAGYTVISYAHPFSACTITPDLDPDLILVDMVLPGRSGLKMAEYLRHNGFEHVPIIAISADKIRLRFASASGLFQATIPKPFDLTQLLDSVKQYAGLYVA